MAIKNFLFSSVPNIVYELGASFKVGSIARFSNSDKNRIKWIKNLFFTEILDANQFWL